MIYLNFKFQSWDRTVSTRAVACTSRVRAEDDVRESQIDCVVGVGRAESTIGHCSIGGGCAAADRTSKSIGDTRSATCERVW